MGKAAFFELRYEDDGVTERKEFVLNQAGHQVTILRWDGQGVLPWRDGSCDFTEHHAFHRSSMIEFSDVLRIFMIIMIWMLISLSYHCQPKEPYRTASVLIAGDNFGADAQLPADTTCRCRVHRHEDVVHRGNMRRALLKLVYWRLWRNDGEMMDRLGTNHGYIYIYRLESIMDNHG